jgi:hypothetical protein
LRDRLRLELALDHIGLERHPVSGDRRRDHARPRRLERLRRDLLADGELQDDLVCCSPLTISYPIPTEVMFGSRKSSSAT